MKYDMVLANRDDAEHAARALHEMGFDGAYTQEGNRDVFFPLLLAARAAPLDLYTNVAIAFPRSPMHLAYTAFDLQRASQGRFALGLGSQIRPHIEKRYSARWDHPVKQMREYVQALHAIFDCFHEGKKLDFRGEYHTFTLMTPTFVPEPLPWGPPPIWMAALGPVMTRTAAEVADGVLIHPFNSERFLREVTVPAVAEGLRRSGRARDGFTLGVDVILCVYGDEEEQAVAEQGCRFNTAFYASTPSYRVTLDVHGWGDRQPRLNEMTKAGRWGEIGSVVDDELLDTVCVRGTPAEAAAVVRSRYADLADRVSFSVPYAVRPDTLAAFVAELHREP